MEKHATKHLKKNKLLSPEKIRENTNKQKYK